MGKSGLAGGLAGHAIAIINVPAGRRSKTGLWLQIHLINMLSSASSASPMQKAMGPIGHRFSETHLKFSSSYFVFLWIDCYVENSVESILAKQTITKVGIRARICPPQIDLN